MRLVDFLQMESSGQASALTVKVRDLAKDLLLAKMQLASWKYFGKVDQKWLDCELWRVTLEPPDRISQVEVDELQALAIWAGGWWRLDVPMSPQFLPFEAWKRIYEVHKQYLDRDLGGKDAK